jgi:phosphate starvation-inducible PhoH-like protein
MMFLTRLGEESRMVITGDITQIDLPRSKQSGLLEVRHILATCPGIDFHTFSGAMSSATRSSPDHRRLRGG